MQRYLAIAGLGLALWLPAAAQESQGPRVVVPARNGSHPRLVKATASNAGITVKTHEGTDVIVEQADGARHGWRRAETTPPGMHRIDLAPGLTVTEEGDVVDIRVPSEAGTITITVPVETSLQLKSSNGGIRVDGVHGEVDASSSNAALDLLNISGTVVADTSNGAIHATMDRVDPSKPLSFISTNGAVDVTLPADLKANFKMRTVNGGIWTDFEMRLAGGQTDTRKGTVTGTVNGGGVEASFSTVNGKIVIHKK